MHEHFGISDVIDAGKAIAASSGIFVLVLVGAYRFHDYSRAVMIMDAAVTFGLVVGFRTSLNLFQDFFARHGVGRRVPLKTLIVGAGAVGGALARVLRHDPSSPRRIVAYVDDDPKKIGRRLNGVPIWGPIGDFESMLEKHAIDEVVVTTPNLTSETRLVLTRTCRSKQIAIRRASLESMLGTD